MELGSCPEIELEKHNSPLNLTGFCVQGIFSPSTDIETEPQLRNWIFGPKMVKNRILMRVVPFDGKIVYRNPSGLKKSFFVFFSCLVDFS